VAFHIVDYVTIRVLVFGLGASAASLQQYLVIGYWTDPITSFSHPSWSHNASVLSQLYNYSKKIRQFT